MKFELQGHPTPRTAAWSIVGDTDWMNRMAGAGRASMGIELDEQGYPNLVGALEGPLGLQLNFEEFGGGWVQNRWFEQHRRYRNGPLAETRYRAALVPVSGSSELVVPQISLELVPVTGMLEPVARAASTSYRKAWQQVLDTLPRTVSDISPTGPASRQLGSTATQALTALRQQAFGGASQVLGELLLHQRPYELQRLRPFAVADRFEIDRDQTLQAFVKATDLGLLELYWAMRCPRCAGQVAQGNSLSDLPDHADCPSCRIDFDTDFEDQVEVLFAAHPAILPRVRESFCTLFPQASPDMRAMLFLEPGQLREAEVDMGRGAWGVAAHSSEQLEVRVGDSGSRSLAVEAGQGGCAEVEAGEVKLEVHNPQSRRVRVALTREHARDDQLSAAILTTDGRYRRRLGAQVLSPNTRVATRSVTLLFTDLSGSTAMYESLGDARAYQLVREHFDVLRGVIEAHRGTVVKTIGDAVMASFHDPTDAARAAFGIQRAFVAWLEQEQLAHPPRVNIGIHRGPALVVHSEAYGMDYFGRTVNIAARAQGKALQGAVVWTEALQELVSVQQVLAEEGLQMERRTARLKGIDGDTVLHAMQWPYPG